MFWFLLLLVLLGGGFYFYQRMRAIEQEIRAEQVQEKERQQSKQETDSHRLPTASEENELSPFEPLTVAAVGAEGLGADNPVLVVIQGEPGIVQSELYSRFPEVNKKQLQQMIKRLADDGQIRRQPFKSSYQLFPA